MDNKIKKVLYIGRENGQSSNNDIILVKISWKNLSKIENLSDYDDLAINLNNLSLDNSIKLFEADVKKLFNPACWGNILKNSGRIIICGDPETKIPSFDPASYLYQPLLNILRVKKDLRTFDYRRIIKNNKVSKETVYQFLDKAGDGSYTLQGVNLSLEMQKILDQASCYVDVQSLGKTSYNTFISCEVNLQSSGQYFGTLYLIPSLDATREDEEEQIILRDWLGIETSLPEPNWTKKILLPSEDKMLKSIEEIEAKIQILQKEYKGEKAKLTHYQGWRRLLFDDGDSLDEWVSKAFITCGAKSCEKGPKGREDRRLNIDGYPVGIVEIKGTRSATFSLKSIRELGQWIDDELAVSGKHPKGIFVGNYNRIAALSQRDPKMFESNGEDYARNKNICIISTINLFYLVILKMLNSLDSKLLWEAIFGTKGNFNADPFFKNLPSEFFYSLGKSM